MNVFLPLLMILFILSCHPFGKPEDIEPYDGGKSNPTDPLPSQVSISCFLPSDSLLEYDVMQANFSLTNSSDQRVTWSSSDPSVASVSSSGKIEANKIGIIQITVTSVAYPSKSASAILKIVFNPIPKEVMVKKGQVRYYLPPNNYTGVIAWMQTIHDGRKAGSSLVEVDYLRLYCISDGKTYLLFSDDYDNHIVWGGLFLRNPWFGSNESESLPHSFENGNLQLTPGQRQDRVYHWWEVSWPRPEVKPNTTKIWMEARIRITGPALVELLPFCVV